VLAAGEVQFLEPLEPADEWQARKALLRCVTPSRRPAAPGSMQEPADVQGSA